MVDEKKDTVVNEEAAAEAIPETTETVEALAETMPEEQETEETPLLIAVRKYVPEATPEDVEKNAVMVIDKLSGPQEKLLTAAKRFPAFAEMLYYISEKGMDPVEAIARTFDRDVLNPPEGAPDWENINSAVAARDEEIKGRDERMATYKKNGEISLENAAKFIEEKEMDEEKGIAFLTFVDSIKADLVDDNISPEHFASLYKAWIYDEKMKEIEELKNAEIETAETRGRNQQITDRMKNADKGDGMPHISSGGNKPKRKLNETEKFFEGVI
ncbi:hypothetical protein [Draconibacterium mangrovi]|uniref:hypothetical protein n=1 Tax=Draconibacterium mangrovi TaxID=2697469 RepID=UPI0013D7FEA8|nr:hypothetical protein [Draconibacterium mangrovi]